MVEEYLLLNSCMQNLKPEQEAQIPYYARKWRDIAYSTERIDRAKATEVIGRAYSLIGKPVPAIVFCGSPRDYINQVSVFAKNRNLIIRACLRNSINISVVCFNH